MTVMLAGARTYAARPSRLSSRSITRLLPLRVRPYVGIERLHSRLCVYRAERRLRIIDKRPQTDHAAVFAGRYGLAGLSQGRRQRLRGALG